MFMQEFIDGPIEHDPNSTNQELAAAIAAGLILCGTHIHENLDKNEDFRIATIVEDENETLGHALAIGIPEFTDDGTMCQEARFYTVNLDKSAIIGSHIIRLTASGQQDAPGLIDEVEQSFDRTDLERLNSLLAKVACRLMDSPDLMPRNNKRVLMCLMDENLAELSAQEIKRPQYSDNETLPNDMRDLLIAKSHEAIQRAKVFIESRGQSNSREFGLIESCVTNLYFRLIEDTAITQVELLHDSDSEEFLIDMIRRDMRGNYTQVELSKGIGDESFRAHFATKSCEESEYFQSILDTLHRGRPIKEETAEHLYEEVLQFDADEIDEHQNPYQKDKDRFRASSFKLD